MYHPYTAGLSTVAYWQGASVGVCLGEAVGPPGYVPNPAAACCLAFSLSDAMLDVMLGHCSRE